MRKLGSCAGVQYSRIPMFLRGESEVFEDNSWSQHRWAEQSGVGEGTRAEERGGEERGGEERAEEGGDVGVRSDTMDSDVPVLPLDKAVWDWRTSVTPWPRGLGGMAEGGVGVPLKEQEGS